MSDNVFQLNGKKPFQIKNKSETEAEIIIYDEIGDSFWYDAISAKDFDKELKSLPDTVTNLTVRINSPGGNVFDGITIYNRLKQHKAKVTVYVDGIAASIASVIAMAGDEVIMSEGALMMIHQAWTVAAGNARDFEEMIDRLTDIDEQIIGIYHRKTKTDKNELRSMLSAETWMDADEAVEMGFATSKTEDEAVIAASMLKDVKCFRRPPNLEKRNKHIKDKLSNLINEFEGNL